MSIYRSFRSTGFVWLLFCNGSAFAQDLQLSAIQQIQTLLREKAARTPAQRKLESHLHATGQIARGVFNTANFPAIGSVMNGIAFDGAGAVHVDIHASVTAALLDQITALGGRIDSAFDQYDAIRAWIPLLSLETVAVRPDVRFIRPAESPIHGRSGLRQNLSPAQRRQNIHRQLRASLPALAKRRLINRRGLFTRPINIRAEISHGADIAQSQAITGAGIKVGVLSDGVQSMATLQAAGNLPAVTVLSGQAGSGDEGTAMLEIVYDLAPGATLYFATASLGEAQFAANILNLAAAGCKIIVDDVRYFSESAFQDGIVAQAVNTVAASGVLFFSSAGNAGNLDSGTSGTWEGDFTGTGGSIPLINGVESKTVLIHAFDVTHNYNSVLQASPYEATLQWSDPWGGSCNDYDLFILNSTMSIIKDFSLDYQTCSQNPREHASIGLAGDRVVIALYSGATRALHLDTANGRLSITTSGATVGHNAAASALTVAATSAQPSIFISGNQSPEYYSSDGPRKMFYNPNGTPITPGNLLFGTNGGLTLSKVDFTAADCGQSAVTGFNPFCGTSAAAPVAAAIAALVWSANPTMNATLIAAQMKTTALAAHAGFGARTVGSGIVMANISTNPLSPQPPGLVSPGNGAGGISLSPTLSWNISTGAASYDVYFGASSPPTFVANTIATAYSLGTLISGTKYYWRVVAKNSAGSASSVTQSFTTIVAQLPPPSVIGVSPASGTGLSQTIAFTFSDPRGWQDLGILNVLINSSLDGRQACYVAYLPTSSTTGTVLLVNDTGATGGPFQSLTLPSSGAIGNSQCTITGVGSAAAGSGNTMTLTLATTLSAGFKGNKVVYLAARDIAANNSGWQAMAVWNVPGSVTTGPAANGVSPARAVTASQTYTFTFSDTTGFQNLSILNFLINNVLDGRNSCYVAFVPNTATTGTIFLVNDAGAAGGPFQSLAVPGTGTVQNSQCTISGVGSSAAGSGNTRTLTLPITFKPGFAGNRVIYAAGRTATLTSNWQAVGTITVP